MNTITKLAVSSVKENRTRSILIMITIFLTTVLLTIIGICGYGLVKTNLQNAGILYGEYYATYSNVTEEQVTAMQIQAQFTKVGKTMIVAEVVSENARMYLRYMDDSILQMANNTLEEGYFPEKENEIAGQREMFKKLGVTDPAIGDTVTIPYRIDDGLIVSGEFVICGIVKSSEVNELKNAYFAYISEEFMKTGVPEEERSYLVCFQVTNEEKLNYDEMKEKIYDLAEQLGIESKNVKINTGYLTWELDPGMETIVVCSGISLIVIVFSILVIYNIFQLGMLQKVKEYGKIKALGASKRQMRSLVVREGLWLSCISIPFGLLVGFIASKLLFVLLGNNDRVQMVNGDLIAKAELFNLPVLLLAALLSVLTVYLSLRKPMRIVGSLSPVDAIRYQERNKKSKGMRKGKIDMSVFSLTASGLSMNRRRTITTIVTLGLSSVLFVTVANVASNMDAEYDARMQVEKGQFMIELDAPLNDEMYPENNYNIIQQQGMFRQSFLDEIRNIHGVTGVEVRNKIPVHLENSGLENSDLGEEEAYCTIAVLGTEDFNRLTDFLKQGEIDYQTAAEQNGVIFTWDFFLEDYGYQIGDDVKFSILDGENEIPFTGKLIGSSSHGDGMFVMTEDTFESLQLQSDMISTVFVYCETGMEAEVQSSLESMIADMEHVEFTAYSNVLELSELGINTMKSALYILLAVVGIIGFMNMANTLITSVMTRKRELGILQAIGMTTSQLNLMLQLEGLLLTAGTLIVALTVGNICGYLAFLKCKEQGVIGIHQYHIPFPELGVMVGALLLLQAVLSFAISRNLQKDTLIDRIRYEE